MDFTITSVDFYFLKYDLKLKLICKILTTILVLLVKITATLKTNIEVFGETFNIEIYHCQIVHFFIMADRFHDQIVLFFFFDNDPLVL